MKILMLPPYCYPEQVSSSHLINDLYEVFADADLEVEIYAPTPCRGIDKETRKKYKEIKNEKYKKVVTIHRFSLYAEGKNPVFRAVRYALCNLIQIHKGSIAENIDIIYSASTPPTQGLMLGRVKKKLSKRYGHQVPLVYNLQDIFPDSLVNAKMTKKGSLIWKIGRIIEDYTYRNADKIITISDGFKANIMAKGVPEKKIVVVPNWVNTDNVYPVDRKDNILFDRYDLDRNLFYICYSGNIGLSQNMDMLLDVAKKIDLSDVRFVLIGDGAAKESIQKRIENEMINNVILLPFQDYSEIAHVFSLGDVGLIISKPGVGGSSVPSKTYCIMASARPILASFDRYSEVGNLIAKAGCGTMAESGNQEEMIQAINFLYRTDRANMGDKGREYLLSELSKEKCTKLYVQTIHGAIET